MSTRSLHRRLDAIEDSAPPPQPLPAPPSPLFEAARRRCLDELRAYAERKGLAWPPRPNPLIQ